MKNYVRGASFLRKGPNDFEAGCSPCGCICTVLTEEWKDYCDFVDNEHQKLLSHRVTRWLNHHFIIACQEWFKCTHLYNHTSSSFRIHEQTIILHVQRQAN